MTDDDDDGPPPEPVVREALRSLRSDPEATIHDVITLWNASASYDVPLLPTAACHAIAAKLEIDRDLANGGMDQVVWNHGPGRTRAYAEAFRAVGVIENADLLDRLAGAVEDYRAAHTHDALAADPVHHFHAYRRAVGGPSFGIPEPGSELLEPLLEYVIEHAHELPAPDALPRRPVQ